MFLFLPCPGNLLRQLVKLDAAKKKSDKERAELLEQVAKYKTQHDEIMAHTVNIKVRLSQSLSLLRSYQLRLQNAQATQQQQQQLVDQIESLRRELSVQKQKEVCFQL